MIDYIDLIGIPYQRNGRNSNGYDCFGLLIELYRRRGMAIRDVLTPETHQLMSEKLEKFKAIDPWIPVKPESGLRTITVMDNNKQSFTFGIKPFSTVQIKIGRYGCHVGMILDSEKFIHAWQGGLNAPIGVCIERLSNWQDRIIGIYDYDDKGR